MASIKQLYARAPRRQLPRKKIVNHSRLLTPQRTRQFHASQPKSDEPIATFTLDIGRALEFSHSVFENIHAYSGLPWALSLPLTAITFRLLYAPAAYIINKHQRDYATYVPLLVAWRNNLRGQAALKFPPVNPGSLLQAERWTEYQMKLRKKELGGNVNPKSYRHFFLTVGFLPIWILNLDVIRRMAGSETTLLGYLRGTGDEINQYIVQAEPSFATEGMLWFADLTAQDPTMILPLAFGAIAIANWWSTWGKNSRKRVRTMETAKSLNATKISAIRNQIVSNILLCVSVLAGPILISYQTPSGICLYLVASAGAMLVQRPVMRKMMGLRPQIMMAQPLVPVLKNPGKMVRKTTTEPYILKRPDSSITLMKR